MKGLEPPRLTAPDPKSGAAANYATSAFYFWLLRWARAKVANFYKLTIKMFFISVFTVNLLLKYFPGMIGQQLYWANKLIKAGAFAPLIGTNDGKCGAAILFTI